MTHHITQLWEGCYRIVLSIVNEFFLVKPIDMHIENLVNLTIKR